MIDTLISIDAQLMYLINVTLANAVTDAVMPIVTAEWFVRPILVLGVIVAAWRGGKYGRITAFLAILAVILSDQLSSQVIKPWVGRLRPCKEHADWIHLLVNCSSGKSFPSSHAVNSFAQAVLWSCRYPRIGKYAYPLASLIALSRIFVGVHYPFDILTGAFLGAVCGGVILVLYSRVLSRFSIFADSGGVKTP
jgi:undecaprenyl-diphosphatase